MSKYSFIVCFFISVAVFSQERPLKSMSKKDRLKIVRTLLAQNSHFEAINMLQDLIKEEPKNTALTHLLAQTYMQVRDYKMALSIYESMIDKEGKSDAWLPYSICLKYLGRYQQSWDAYETFAKNARKATNLKGNVLTKFNENYEYQTKCFEKTLFLSKSKPNKDVIISHFGNEINSAYSDISPCLKDSNTLIFASLRADTVLNYNFGEAHFNQIKLMQSTKNEDDTWADAKPINSIKSSGYHIANGTFNQDKTKFYYTKCKYDSKFKMNCNIYVSNFKNNTFKNGKKIEGKLNSSIYTSTQPAIGGKVLLEGKKYDVLYFSSNPKGSFGGMDIYYALLDSNNNVKLIENLGNKINTQADEVTPFYDHSNNILYFSSNENNGLGGYDIYQNEGNIKSWSNTLNLGNSYNSSYDDTYFSIDSTAQNAFFVSNRPGGFALTSETCCDDIYSINVRKSNNLAIIVYNQLNMFIPYDSININFQTNEKIKIPTYFTSNDSLKPLYKLEPQTVYHSDIVYKNDTFKILISTKLKSKIDTNFVYNKEKINILFTQNKKENQQIITIYLKEKAKPLKDTLIPKTITETPLLVEPSTVPSIAMLTPPKNEIEITTKNKKTIKIDIDSLKKINNKDIIDFTYNFNFGYNEKDFIKTQDHNFEYISNILKKHPESYVQIEAHSDSIGKDDYNKKLSQLRANEIKSYMIKKGVSQSHILAIGFGESQPIAPNSMPNGSDNPLGRAQNRRGVIKVIKKITK